MKAAEHLGKVETSHKAQEKVVNCTLPCNLANPTLIHMP